MNNQQAAQRLSLVAQSAAKRGWLPATGGNLSAKTDSGYVVSASGVEKSRLSAEQFLQFDRAFQLTRDMGYAPSADTALHFKVYQLFAKAQSCACSFGDDNSVIDAYTSVRVSDVGV